MHKIVEALKGEISVNSRQATDKHPGETIFRIWLPRVEEKTPDASPDTSPDGGLHAGN